NSGDKSSVSFNVDVSKETTQDILAFAKRVFGPLAELGDLLSDQIRKKRLENAVKILAETKKICDEAGIDPERIPQSLAIPLLEKASNQFDDIGDDINVLRLRWASLLANSAKSKKRSNLQFINILAELDSHQADMLSRMKASANKHELFKPDNMNSLTVGADQPVTWDGGVVDSIEGLKAPGRLYFYFDEADIANTEEFSLADFDEASSFLQLHRLGLVKLKTGSFRPHADREKCFYVYIDITPFGFEFISACEKPDG
ncbi:Abi-alpha family protein, partial [Trichormus sp. NMC-1]|uniref:Abi-alpha family protein n=1 Tax=Trichormus sp. NMC-1 TaxID=1853259 RepID=UPI00115FF0F1